MANVHFIQAATSESVMIKLGDALYLPGKLNSKDSPYIQLDQLNFGLEQCADLADLETLTINDEPFLQKALRSSNATRNQRQYGIKNKLLKFGLDVFTELKPDIGYKDNLKIDETWSLAIADLYDEAKERFGRLNEYYVSRKPEDKPRNFNVACKLLPENCLFLNNIIYKLNKKKQAGKIAVQLDKNLTLVPAFWNILPDFAKSYETSLCKALIESSDEEAIEMQQVKERLEILDKLKEGDFYSHGLIAMPPNNGTISLSMSLPKMAMKIPGTQNYFYLAQASLNCSVEASSGEDTVFEFSDMMYESRTKHPLIYTREDAEGGEGKAGTVCLREGDKWVQEGAGLSTKERLVRLFIINRQVLMYGTNLFKRHLIYQDQERLNHHFIGLEKYASQHVTQDYVDKHNVLVVGDTNVPEDDD